MHPVFFLWHSHGDDEKLIGVYVSRGEAERAQQRAARRPRFSADPEGFEIAEYVVGHDHRAEGFVTAR